MKYVKLTVLLIGLVLLNINVVYADNVDYTFFAAKKTDTTKYEIKAYDKSASKVSCDELIDGDTKKLIKEVIQYPRIAVPAILIVFGTIDFFKATMAGKEDEIKKAQRNFIKRVIAGVAVFMVPFLVDIIIWFANMAWQGLGYGTPCPMPK